MDIIKKLLVLVLCFGLLANATTVFADSPDRAEENDKKITTEYYSDDLTDPMIIDGGRGGDNTRNSCKIVYFNGRCNRHGAL